MCGIVGLFLKNPSWEPKLGSLLSDMLVTMSDRGPDSAGIAIYRDTNSGGSKLTVQSANPLIDFNGLQETLSKSLGSPVRIDINDTHAVINCGSGQSPRLRKTLAELMPSIRIMSDGETVEIYKEVGEPKDVAERFQIENMSGTHGIGHTRMATESAVTTMGAHPFSTGPDQCLVHNGSLSNHNSLRRELRREGITFETDNDTEVAAAYLTHQMSTGKNLGEALEEGLADLDGFYTFVVGTKEGFGILRDPIACKPAVLAETDAYVAFGSEYRALVGLPDIEAARVWEPEPATVYFWER